jgi:L-ribulose-5-phosphate 3-epimerase UlaE
MDDHETRIKALEQGRKELEDSFIVMTHLETKQSNLIKIWAEETEKIRAQVAEQRKLNQETDKRIADLVSAIGTLIARMPQPGSQP